jgi:PPK2 family polyphosphate:nucleotide phosphotransferase
MKLKIVDYPTFDKTLDKKETQEKTKKTLKKIGKLQYKMYAQNKFSLLIIFQGTDASGKDGVTKDLIEYCNAVGIKIHSFKKPTEDEFAHDFLHRVHAFTPGRGEMQIFIRSHYEDILVPSVEKYIANEVLDKRFEQINSFEKLIESNNTMVLKFFLNISKEAQEERLLERIELKKKHWKHKDSDWVTREKFDDYITVYEKIINKCNDIPWNIVPADKNWQKTYYVAETVFKKLKELDLKWPELVSEKFILDTPPAQEFQTEVSEQAARE